MGIIKKFDMVDTKQTNQANKNIIYASPLNDPGARDLFGNFEEKIEKHRGQAMSNLKIFPNDKGEVVTDHDDYPATDVLFDISCFYKIEDQKRNYVLIVEDMQYCYEPYVKYRIPHVK